MRSSITLVAALAMFAIAAPGATAAGGGPMASTTMPGSGSDRARGARPAVAIPFPEIIDWRSLKVSLRRDGCFGSCPIYGVEISGDGTVTYDGKGFVFVEGRHVSHIPQDRVRPLFEAFRKADFFHLFASYQGGITDMATYTLSLSYDGHAMTVTDYVGHSVGMPADVIELENLVDETADTASWVEGSEHSLAALRAEGWRFDGGRENSHLLMRAAESGPDALVEGLLAAGVSATTAGGAYGCRAAANAAYRHRPAMLRALLRAGAPVYVKAGLPENESGWNYQGVCDVLLSAAKSGWPDVIAAVLAKHPKVNRAGEDGPPLMSLGAAVDSDKPPLPDLGKSEALLIAAGADVNYRNRDGYTPLQMATDDAGMMRAVLAAGARGIDEPGPDGRTPLMSARNAGVAIALLQHGANPRLKDSDGKTALDFAVLDKRADVEALLRQWMAKRPAP
jgi:ankyrin repeat protein